MLAQRRAALLFGAVALLTLVALVTAGLKVSDALGLFSNSVGTPSLIALSTATATSAPTVEPTMTATPAPTATPRTVYVTPPPGPPQPLSISPSTVTFSPWSKTCAPTGGMPVIISNLDSKPVTWKWTTSQPSLSGFNFYWSLNSSINWHSGLPSNSRGIAAYDGKTVHSDSLYLRMSCNAFDSSSTYTVTMTDSLNRSYKIVFTSGN